MGYQIPLTTKIHITSASMIQPTFASAREVVTEGWLAVPVVPATRKEMVTFSAYSPSSSEIEADSLASGLLILADMYYPGWNVYIDGVRQPMYATNSTMRGVTVPAGQHLVEFKYEPPSFRIGLYISGSTAVVIILMLMW
jgi:hypothetical protein